MKNKFIILILALGFIISCKAQEPNKEKMEKYDFETKSRFKGINPVGIIRNGVKIVMYPMTSSGAFYYEYLSPPYPYKRIKVFHPSGELKIIGKEVGKSFPIGETTYYDKQGNITKVDEDKKFGKIKLDDLLEFIEKEGYINLETGEGLETVEILEDGRVQPIPSRFGISPNIVKNQYWIITIFAQPWNTFTETIYHIDKETGEVLLKESKEKFPIM